MFAVVLTSVITSSAITLVVLFVTGNLTFEAPVTTKENIEVVPSQVVPSLVGIPTKSAKELLKMKDMRLIVRSERPDKNIAKGQIVEQSPLPESELTSGGVVEVIVSSGAPMLTVPSIVGKTLDDSKPLIIGAGLDIAQTMFEGEGEPGTILEVTPEPGSKVEEGTKLTLVVAPMTAAVPDVLGFGIGKARKAINDAGFEVGKINWRYNENRPANLVLAQDPEPGANVAPGSKINLVLNPE